MGDFPFRPFRLCREWNIRRRDSYEYWRARFNSDPGAVGQALIVNGHTVTIIGVAPPGFTGTTLGIRAAVFMPLSNVAAVHRHGTLERIS